MTDDTYNGWTNYPTWCVNLWLDNDPVLVDDISDRVAEILDRPSASQYWTVEQSHRYQTADMLKDYVEELAEIIDPMHPTVRMGASFQADLLGYALGQVDWNEIADAWISAAEYTMEGSC